jgi:hypothetical protein
VFEGTLTVVPVPGLHAPRRTEPSDLRQSVTGAATLKVTTFSFFGSHWLGLVAARTSPLLFCAQANWRGTGGSTACADPDTSATSAEHASRALSPSVHRDGGLAGTLSLGETAERRSDRTTLPRPRFLTDALPDVDFRAFPRSRLGAEYPAPTCG